MKAIFAVIFILFTTPVFANESPKALQDAFVAAMKANDAAGLAACYSEDAISFAVDHMAGKGPEFVQADWGRFFSVYRVLDIQLKYEHMESHGDTAIAWGLFELTVEPVVGGESVVMAGRYMGCTWRTMHRYRCRPGKKLPQSRSNPLPQAAFRDIRGNGVSSK